MERIRKALTWHVVPVAMLGHRRTSLRAKMRVFCHMLALECKDRTMLSKLFKSIVSVHTDYGTEIGLTRCGPATFDDLIPYLHVPTTSSGTPSHMPGAALDDNLFQDGFDQPGDDVCLFEGEAPQQDAHDCADLSAAFEGPDLMHIIHNVTNGLGSVMNLYAGFLAGLKRVAKLLSEKESKQQLIQTCFSELPGLAWKGDVSRFQGSVHEERWGTIAHAIKNVHSLELPLRTCWSLKNFLGGKELPAAQARSEPGSGEFGHDLAALDADLTSDTWWASLKVMLQIAAVQRRVSDWANSCPCHDEMLVEDLPADVRDHMMSCPLRGRRAAELAGGDFFALFQRLFQHHATEVEASLPRSLSQEQILDMMRDFEAARSHILAVYVLKLSFWQQPPNALAGIAHDEPRVRARSVEACLSSSSQHPRVLALKAHMSECWDFLERGAVWDGPPLPFLAELAVEMRMVFSSAWRVEGQHARTKRAITAAPNQSAAYVSLAHRLGELKLLLKDNPDALEPFAELVGQVKSAARACSLLGFSQAAAEGCGWLDQRAHNKSFKLIYHDDAHAKYSMPLPSQLRMRVKNERALREVVDCSELVLAGESVRLRHKLALDAVRAAAKLRMYISIPFNAKAFVSLQAILAPCAVHTPDLSLAWTPPETVSSWGSKLSVVPVSSLLQGAGDLVTQEVMFFSVVHGRPASFRRSKPEGALSLDGAWLIQAHRIMHMDVTEKKVLLGLQGLSLRTSGAVEEMPLTLHPELLSLTELQSMRCWEVEAKPDCLAHSFDNQFTSTLSRQQQKLSFSLLSRLVRAPEGLPLTTEDDFDTRELLDIFVAEGLVAGPPWKLSTLGHERLTECVTLQNYKPVLRPSEGPLCEATAYQILLVLDQQGWSHEVVSRARHKQLKKDFVHTPSEPKVWYTEARPDNATPTVSRFYLLALAECLEKGVPYGATDEAYQKQLGIAEKVHARKRKPLAFTHCSEETWPLPKPKRQRQAGRRPRREAIASAEAEPLADRDCEAASAGHASDAEDAISLDAGAELRESSSISSAECSVADDDAASSSDSSSSSSSRSSSAGSGDSKGSGGASAPASAPKAAAKARGRQIGRGFQWGPHLFTPVGPAGSILHWQVRCGTPAHQCKKHCTKKRSLKFGGEAEVLRLLKYWASLGHSAPTQEEHLQLWSERVMLDHQVGNVPTVEELDAEVEEE